MACVGIYRVSQCSVLLEALCANSGQSDGGYCGVNSPLVHLCDLRSHLPLIEICVFPSRSWRYLGSMRSQARKAGLRVRSRSSDDAPTKASSQPKKLTDNSAKKNTYAAKSRFLLPSIYLKVPKSPPHRTHVPSVPKQVASQICPIGLRVSA